jgi:uncharacterized protein YtpQ (UPF0354 family)
MSDRAPNAIAYLKAEVPSDDPSPALELTGDDAVVMRPFASGLHIFYLIDEGESFSYVQERDLRAAGIGGDELHRKAIANLAALAEGNVTVEENGPIWSVSLDGNFEASLVLLDDLWTRGLREYAEEPVVAIPSRDVLAFCDAESVAGIAELHAVVKRVWPSGDHLVSENLYQRVDGKWRVHSYGSQ